MEPKGIQKGLDGQPLFSLWNITAGPAAGTTVALPPFPSEREKLDKFLATNRAFQKWISSLP